MGLLQSGSKLIRKKEGGVNIAKGAVLAFSSRKVIASYSGNNFIIRRSNDNTTTNIGFDANGDTNSAEITSFAGSNSALIQTWFNQANNNNASQLSAGNQPFLVSSGVINTLNGKVSPAFTNFPARWMSFTEINLSADFTIFAVLRTFTSGFGEDSMVLGHSSINNQVRVKRSGSNVMSLAVNSDERISQTLSIDTSVSASVLCWRRESGIITFRQNNGSFNPSPNTAVSGDFRLDSLGRTSFGNEMNGSLAELIGFNSALSDAEIDLKVQNEIDYFNLLI